MSGNVWYYCKENKQMYFFRRNNLSRRGRAKSSIASLLAGLLVFALGMMFVLELHNHMGEQERRGFARLDALASARSETPSAELVTLMSMENQ